MLEIAHFAANWGAERLYGMQEVWVQVPCPPLTLTEARLAITSTPRHREPSPRRLRFLYPTEMVRPSCTHLRSQDTDSTSRLGRGRTARAAGVPTVARWGWFANTAGGNNSRPPRRRGIHPGEL